MLAHSVLNRSVFRVGALAMAVVALLLVSATSALADPGAPGLDRPATSVYAQGDERPVLGEQDSGGAGDQPGLAGADLGGGNGGSDESLPFTGFAAALVLGGGLTLLLFGIAMRVGARRLRHAES
jgi:hypothetical protein